VICNEKKHDYSAMGQTITTEPGPVPKPVPRPEPRPRPRPPVIEPIIEPRPIDIIEPVPIAPPCPPGENCIFKERFEIVEPKPVRMLADWELALNEWDA